MSQILHSEQNPDGHRLVTKNDDGSVTVSYRGVEQRLPRGADPVAFLDKVAADVAAKDAVDIAEKKAAHEKDVNHAIAKAKALEEEIEKKAAEAKAASEAARAPKQEEATE